MERLSDERVREIVKGRISVNPQHIAVMKGLLLKQPQGNTESMIHSAVRVVVGFERPQNVVLRGNEADIKELERLGDYVSWIFCAVEAVWGLVNTGVLLPSTDHNLTTIDTTTQINHQYNGSRYGGGERFDNLGGVPYFPPRLTQTRCDPQGFILTDPDLYLETLRPHVPHPEIVEALEEAVKCFRSGLYMASVVMLGKASEGIWIELGKALIGALPKAVQPNHAKLRTDLDSPLVGFAKKLREIMKLYESKQGELGPLTKAGSMSLDDVRLASTWSELVRDSRNVIHYGNAPSMPNNYENVATLLLTGSKHLQNLYALYHVVLANPGT